LLAISQQSQDELEFAILDKVLRSQIESWGVMGDVYFWGNQKEGTTRMNKALDLYCFDYRKMPGLINIDG